MNEEHKRICRELFRLSYEHGFHRFPLRLVAEATGIPVDQMFDEDSESGLLWPFHAAASGELAGMLELHGRGREASAAIAADTRSMLEVWCDFHGP
jgi:hypothetical protein